VTAALAFDPRVAEAFFSDDEEALDLIRTLALFRSKEFETAGKALTRQEDKILAPLVRGDLRVYEATRNAMSKGLLELKKEQKALEVTYPALKTYNDVIRGELGMGGETPAAPGAAGVDVAGERQRANDAIARGANREAVAARFKQKTGEEL
jgi:hypothetical protein